MAATSFSLSLPNADATAEFAQALGRILRQGDTLLLEGDVGAGKTHLARALIQSLLAAPEDVPSPTFTLVQTYETQKGEVWHTDLYRLSAVNEIEELGLIDAFETAICLVEWPDRLGSLSPAKALTLSFETNADPDARMLILQWSEPSWEHRLKALMP